MFRFGKQVESALLALKALSDRSASGLSISEICVKHGLSKNTLAKVMQSLHSAQIVGSFQGQKGGYRLQRGLAEISFFEVLAALGEIKKLHCSEHSNCSLADNCSISSPLQKWERKFEQQLKSTFLLELLCEDSKNHLVTQEQGLETACL